MYGDGEWDVLTRESWSAVDFSLDCHVGGKDSGGVGTRQALSSQLCRASATPRGTAVIYLCPFAGCA